MHRQKFIVSLFVIAVFLTAGALVFGQGTAPIRGRLQLKKADNTIVPVADAEIIAYRTDINKGKLPSAKTDKKGYFSFAGVPYAQLFVLVAVAPGIKAGYYPNVKANMDNIVIEVEEGDGTAPTEEQVREALASVSTVGGEMTAEEKKKQEELAKKNAEIEAKNAKIKTTNEVVNRALAEGNKARESGDLETALAKYEEGYNADQTFAGTAPVFLINKADVLKRRAVNNYQKIIADPSTRPAMIESVKKDLLESTVASQKSLDILKSETTTDVNLQKRYEGNKKDALSLMTEAYRLLIETRADDTKMKDAVATLDAYVAVEPDAPTKTKAQMRLADAIRKSGNSDDAIPIYRKILETSPDEPNALAGLGLSLFNSGAIAKAIGDSEKNEAKKQEGTKLMQEGLDFMSRFVETSPVKPDDTPQMKELKASVKEAVDYIKTQEKLSPQKSNKPTTPKKKT